MPRRQLFTFGCDNEGRLGLGGTGGRHRPTPTLVPFFEGSGLHIRSVVAAGFHTFVLSDRVMLPSGNATLHAGEPAKSNNKASECAGTILHVFGDNEFGQLALGDRAALFRATPALVPLPMGVRGVRALSAGAYHSFLLATNGELYSCGRNDQGQLGLGDTTHRPGWSAVALDARSLLAGGRSAHRHEVGGFAAAPGNAEDEAVTAALADANPTLHVLSVSCGSYHTAVLGTFPLGGSGECEPPATAAEAAANSNWTAPMLFTCGKGTFGELGTDPDVWDLAAATEHRVKRAITERSRQQGLGASAEDGVLGDGNAAVMGAAEGNTTAAAFGGGGGEAGGGESQHVRKPYKFKVPANLPVRRQDFSSLSLRAVSLASALAALVAETEPSAQASDVATASTSGGQNNALPPTCFVESVSAQHHHTSLVVAVVASGVVARRLLVDFGCYYNNRVEGIESSRPRRVPLPGTLPPSTQLGGIRAGDEVLVTWCERGDDKDSRKNAGVWVQGKGRLGLGDTDDWKPEWHALPLGERVTPQADQGATVCHGVFGVQHFMVLLSQQAPLVSSPEAAATAGGDGVPGGWRDRLFLFGDNYFGQLGAGHDTEVEGVVELPASAFATGKAIGGPAPRLSIVQVAAGFRHSAVLVDMFESDE